MTEGGPMNTAEEVIAAFRKNLDDFHRAEDVLATDFMATQGLLWKMAFNLNVVDEVQQALAPSRQALMDGEKRIHEYAEHAYFQDRVRVRELADAGEPIAIYHLGFEAGQKIAMYMHADDE